MPFYLCIWCPVSNPEYLCLLMLTESRSVSRALAFLFIKYLCLCLEFERRQARPPDASAARGGEDANDLQQKLEEVRQPPPRVRPVPSLVPRPPQTSLVKFVGNIYTLKCRYAVLGLGYLKPGNVTVSVRLRSGGPMDYFGVWQPRLRASHSQWNLTTLIH